MRRIIKFRHYPGKFTGYRRCYNEDIMVLVCHVILQEVLVKGLCDFMVEAHQGKLPSGGICSSGGIYLVCQVILT